MGINISASNMVNAVALPKTKLMSKPILPPQKPDTFEKRGFNLDDAMKSLSRAKIINDGKESNKFDKTSLANIRGELNKAPEKWEAINTLAKTPFVKAETIVDLASRSKKVIDAVMPYALEPDNDKTKAKYSSYVIQELTNYADFEDFAGSIENLKNSEPLIKTKFDGVGVLNLIKDGYDDELLGKIYKKADKLAKITGDKPYKISLANGRYDENEAVIGVITDDGDMATLTCDSNFRTKAIDTVHRYKANGKDYVIQKSKDLKNHTISKTRMELDNDNMDSSVTSEVRIVNDKKGNLIRKEILEPSDVKGVYNIRHIDAKGNVKVISEGKIDKKTGITTVRKNMTSLDGTKTEYLYEDDPQGNRIMDYKITDKNGKVLLNNSSSFEVVEKNHYISSKNGKKYDVVVGNHNIDVKELDDQKRKVTISIDKKIKGDKKEILKSLKATSGEQLMKLAETKTSLVGKKDYSRSAFDTRDNAIHTGSNLYAFMHELGHAIDKKGLDSTNLTIIDNSPKTQINNNEKFEKVYEKEREAFVKAFPRIQRNHIDYFINMEYWGKPSEEESIAESNALLTAPNSMDCLAIRSQYFQQYFPRTIATLDKLL